MIVSVNWLKDYVDINVDIDRFCEGMIMSGSNIETCVGFGDEIRGVKIGRIEKIEKHPDADRLKVCGVDIGRDENIQVVTGAENIFEGAYVPVALDSSHIPGPLHGKPKTEGGVEIKAGILRGVQSDGMLCSASELGFPEKVVPMRSKDGIWILEGDRREDLGKEAAECLGLRDHIIDFEITPNRSDCLSMIGMAREAAATFGEKLVYPESECETSDERAEDYIDVEIRSELCRRYTARVIKDVKIMQSPWWLQKRLMAAGMRPINNIVDITNFVMLEYGQPLHAFDINSLEGGRIIIENARDGEKFKTLDGTERTMDDTMLMIKDAVKPVALAGVMGGLNSEITDETDTVVLESANFVDNSVRMTSKKLGLRTESSARYEKGIDPNLCEKAADRVCRLIELLGCGKVLTGAVDVYPDKAEALPVSARVSRINKVLGTELSREEMERYLTGLEMKVDGKGDEMLVTPPTVRLDLLEEVDFVEEVARMYGYDNLPMTLPDTSSEADSPKEWEMRRLLREILCGMGASEIQTYSFSNDRLLDRIGIDEDSWERNFVRIINPMGEETSALRSLLTPGMLETLGRNYSRNVENVRAYEIGNTFVKNLIEPDELPDEAYNLSIGCYGDGEDFYTLKGMIEALLRKFGITKLYFEAESEYGVYHPGRCARVMSEDSPGNKVELGIMGEVYPDVAENFGIDTRAYCAELFAELIFDMSDREVHFEPLPKYPATVRDMALIVDEDLEIGRIEQAVRELAPDILENIRLFDVYRGKQLEDGKKSVAFSLRYRDKNKTLTDSRVDEAHGKIVEMLEERFGAVLRD